MRILVVCFTESTHSQSWIDLFRDEDEFDVRIYAHNLAAEGTYLPQAWKRPTYILEHPKLPRVNAGIITLFPKSRFTRFFSARILHRFPLANWYLQKVIKNWKPDIVHSLSLMPTGYFTWQALSKIENNRPLFVVSSWGQEINLGKHVAEEKLLIEEVLHNCDGFIADCGRDIGNALSLGLSKEKLALDFAVPVTGGIDMQKNIGFVPVEERNVILLPKAFEGFSNKVLPVLEALNTLRDKLEGFEVHLLATSVEVNKYLVMMPEAFKKYCHVHSQLTSDQISDLMKRSRVMIAPSISDGTPMILLEAMSAGALPVVSPLESIEEWIQDGRNGLLVHALYPDKIVKALDRALTDNELFNSAAIINREIIEKRANRQQIKLQVMNYYRALMDKKGRSNSDAQV